MSEDISKESLKKSIEVIGELYPVLENQDGKILDGNHRVEANPKHYRKTVKTKNRMEEILVRLHAHHRRRISQEELKGLVAEIADELVRQGTAKTEVSVKLTELLPYTPGYVRELLSEEYKEPGKVEAGKGAWLTMQKPGLCEGCKLSKSNVSLWENRLKLCDDCQREAKINPEKFLHIAGVKNGKVPSKKKVPDEELSNLISCGQCGRSVGILNAKAYDGKDLCPSCYDKAIHSKTDRQARMQPGVSKFEDEVRLDLQAHGLPLGQQNDFITLPFKFSDSTWYLPKGVLALRLNGEAVHKKRGDKDKAIVQALETLGVRVLSYTYKSGSEAEKEEIRGLVEEKLKELGWVKGT